MLVIQKIYTHADGTISVNVGVHLSVPISSKAGERIKRGILLFDKQYPPFAAYIRFYGLLQASLYGKLTSPSVPRVLPSSSTGYASSRVISWHRTKIRFVPPKLQVKSAISHSPDSSVLRSFAAITVISVTS